jgi:hypothetical protein
MTGTCAGCGRARPGHLSRTDAFYCNSCRRGPARRCGFCDQVRPIKVNWPAGPACSTCYQQVRENPAECAGCRQTRVLIGTDATGLRTCGPCADASIDYRCTACRQADRVYDPGSCNSCRYGPTRRCAFCDQLRAVIVNWPTGPACTTCYQRVRENPAECANCLQIRVLIGIDATGARTCGPCAGSAVDYLCRACGQAGRVYENGRCFRCAVDDRLRDMLGAATGQIPAQLQPLADALLAAEKPRSVLVWLRRSSAAQLLAQLATQNQPITHELLDSLPVNQDVHYVRQILVHTEILPQRLEYLDRLLPWLEQTLADRPAAHARLVRPYAHWHLLHRARRRARRHGTFTTNSAARSAARSASSSICSTTSTVTGSPSPHCNSSTSTGGSLSARPVDTASDTS